MLIFFQVLKDLYTVIGGQNIDSAICRYVTEYVTSKFPGLDISGERQIRRMYAAVNKAKSVLSTILQTDIVFPLAEQDIKIHITRDQLKDLCKNEISGITKVIHQMKELVSELGIKIDALEVMGGGARMPFVKELLHQSFDISLSHTLDSDLDLAVGAAVLGANQTVGFALKYNCKDLVDLNQEAGSGLSEQTIQELRAKEEEMQANDAVIVKRAKLRNNIETFCFGIKNDIDEQKYKDCFPELSKKRDYEEQLDAALVWVDDSSLTVEELEEKLNFLTNLGKELIPKFFEQQVEEAKEKMRKEAEAAAAAAAAAAEGPGEKKPKTNNQKIEVAKEKKELGNKHFVDLDYPSAIKRYTQALEFCKQLYDETPEQLEEVKTIKLACYLNIAQCCIKVKVYDRAIENCKSALILDANNTKGLYRRANAYFLTKEYELAKADLTLAAQLTPDDKAVTQLLTKTDAQIARQKENEKNMCARMFG